MFALAFSVGLVAIPFAACSNQGEGDRCDRRSDNTGTDDCQDGLVCTAQSELGSAAQSDICCPLDRTQATTTICAVHFAPADSGLAGDGGSTDSASGDDSSSDAPPESSANDAPSEGG
jgi:hypothetical protein